MIRSRHRTLVALVLSLSWGFGANGRPLTLHSLTGQQQGETMSFLAWIVLGLVAGFIGSKIQSSTQGPPSFDSM